MSKLVTNGGGRGLGRGRGLKDERHVVDRKHEEENRVKPSHQSAKPSHVHPRRSSLRSRPEQPVHALSTMVDLDGDLQVVQVIPNAKFPHGRIVDIHPSDGGRLTSLYIIVLVDVQKTRCPLRPSEDGRALIPTVPERRRRFSSNA